MNNQETPIIGSRELDYYRKLFAGQLEFFELLATLDHDLGRLPPETPPAELFARLHGQLEHLFPAEVAGFYIPNPETFEFELSYCRPDHLRGVLQKTVDELIEAGSFGWAFQQNRCVPLKHGADKRPILLHSLATPSRKYGIYLALPQAGMPELRDLQLSMVSLVLQRGVFTLEHNHLFTQIKNQNATLEKLVQDRTRELADALDTTRQAQAQLEAIYNESPDVILVVDTRDLTILKANPAAFTLLGFKESDLTTKPLSSLFDDATPLTPFDLLNPVRAGRVLLSRKAKRQGGGTCEVDLTAGFLPWNQERALLVILRDATLRSQIEEERLKLSKLESLGTLAGGIAHDFNNILQIIHGNLGLAQLSPNNPATVAECIQAALGAGERARHIAGQLLTFSKGGAPVRKPVDLAAIIRSTAGLCFRAANIKAQIQLPPQLHPVELDEVQIRQAIQQLLLNALDATRDHGGELIISAVDMTLQPGDLAGFPPGPYVMISVQDSGEGIPAENLPRVFDPYFTTKPHRSGLGLTAAYSIIRNHGGEITLRSNPGKGTLARIYLPAPTRTTSTKPTPPGTPPATQTGQGYRILHMDDEELIRDVVSVFLTKEGYELTSVPNGEEAIAAAQSAIQNGKPFHCCILDLTIHGGTGGRETMAHLQKLQPTLQGIVCSGYSNDPVMANPQDYGFTHVLPKPFVLAELLQMVENLCHKA